MPLGGQFACLLRFLHVFLYLSLHLYSTRRNLDLGDTGHPQKIQNHTQIRGRPHTCFEWVGFGAGTRI
jgi:hypothetical protein